MSNFIRSFSSIDRKVVNEVSSRTVESEETTESHEVVENPENWNPPVLHATDVYKTPSLFNFRKKTILKEVEASLHNLRHS